MRSMSLLGPSPAFPSDKEVQKDRAVRVQLAAVPTVLRWVGSQEADGKFWSLGVCLFFFLNTFQNIKYVCFSLLLPPLRPSKRHFNCWMWKWDFGFITTLRLLQSYVPVGGLLREMGGGRGEECRGDCEMMRWGQWDRYAFGAEAAQEVALDPTGTHRAPGTTFAQYRGHRFVCTNF